MKKIFRRRATRRNLGDAFSAGHTAGYRSGYKAALKDVEESPERLADLQNRINAARSGVVKIQNTIIIP